MTALRDIAEVRAELHRAIAQLGPDDVRVLAAVVAELPRGRLVAACEAETDRGIEGPRGEGTDGKPLRVPPTSLHVQAIGSLLATWDVWSRCVGLPPRIPRGADGVLLASRRAALAEARRA